MTQSFDNRASSERPDPAHYLRKQEGIPGGLRPAPKPQGAEGSPRIAASITTTAAASPLGHKAAGSGSSSPTPGSPTKGSTRSTLFRRMYERGDLPVRVEQARHNTIKWTADLSTIDLHYYLPVFVDGLLETQEPFRMLARRGTEELMAAAGGERLLPVIPQLVGALRAALRSPSQDVIQAGLAALRQVAGSSQEAGLALVAYYRQLLPPLSRHLSDNLNIGDKIDYAQASHRGSLGDVVAETLHVLERGGGPEAFHHIKYHVPLYESCCRPSRLTRKP